MVNPDPKNAMLDDANRADGVDLQGHVATERSKRLQKAQKIEQLLGLPLSGARVLDLGTGSGVIAEYLASRGAIVSAADRDVGEFSVRGIEPIKLNGIDLPYESEFFDAIIFNHVIEHVGDRPIQAAILGEIRRCLRPNGKLYVAVPNKWAAIEPHYRLPLLGALPRRVSNRLVRMSGRHPFYDCYPFSHAEFSRILRTHFSEIEDISTEAYYWVAANEIGGLPGKLLTAVPEWIIRNISGAMPTLIFIATKEVSPSSLHSL